ncbi:hypothetical protein GA0115255_122305, partial [Streptomyces sp. Ncost-T6T-2b]
FMITPYAVARRYGHDWGHDDRHSAPDPSPALARP